MIARRHASEGMAVTEVGPSIAVMFVGVAMAIVVMITGTPAADPVEPGSSTTDVIRAGERQRDFAPAIARFDRAISTEA